MTRVWAGEDTREAVERLVPGAVTRTTQAACYIEPGRIADVLAALRTDPESDLVYLTNLCGADYWDRLEVVYFVQSFDRNQIACIKVELTERDDPVVPSVVPVFHGAWMQECEAYDMFGIRFEGHPNLHRILLWDGFPGWPLRKDFLSMPGGLQPGLNEFAGTARREAPPVSEVNE